ncbi:MAG: hypothetical protein DRO40_01525 [Thermoprotei archaeon]|nr:MAG: hypothetical protein DRO40_01525 [Thermoprotei archaeon]
MEDISEKIILHALKEELRIVNKHLPYRRPSLSELLSMEIPYIVLRDGTIHLINIDELKTISKYIDPSEYDDLKIPILIEVNPSLGKNTYIIRDPLGAKVIAKLLGLTKYHVPLVIYNPQLYEIRLKLRTTTTIIFVPE